jgi:hypothetical protein
LIGIESRVSVSVPARAPLCALRMTVAAVKFA